MMDNGAGAGGRGMSLDGLRVFLAEDESLIAMSIEDMLADLGCNVVVAADNIGDAVDKAGAAGFDCAILDVNLRGKEVFPVAEILSQQGIPFIFSSGYGRSMLPDQFRTRPTVSKPFDMKDLSAALEEALNPVSTGTLGN